LLSIKQGFYITATIVREFTHRNKTRLLMNYILYKP
jgi:hypothetical protein